MAAPLSVAGLFAGVGGFELGFHRGWPGAVRTELLCEVWAPARAVLQARFPGVPLHPDVRELREVPGGVDLLTVGFPCTDLSQVGRTAGITGTQSGLVEHVFQALRRTAAAGRPLPWLVIENVANLLVLHRGRGIAYLIEHLEELGYRWAYRVVDSRFTGVPQRRRRVILVASTTDDPRPVLLAEDAGEPDPGLLRDDAFGFSWTEGRAGLGWARDAVPTLKGGSAVGIPSPPALWVPAARPGRQLLLPTIEDAEELQGLPRGWTAVGEPAVRRNGPRWKLVGNAVTVGVAAWVAERLACVVAGERWAGPEPATTPGTLPPTGSPGSGGWPRAAWGQRGRVVAVPVSEFPRRPAYRHLLEVVDPERAPALSRRATAGFRGRLELGNLGRHPGFREAVAAHLDALDGGSPPRSGPAAVSAPTGAGAGARARARAGIDG